MIKYKIRGIAFECDEREGTAVVTMPGETETFKNAIEGWTFFVSRALWPYEQELRDKLEEHGFNRHTGVRNFFTESEKRAMYAAEQARALRERKDNGEENTVF